MRPSQSVLFIIVGTFIALIYVHQQVELVKLSYEIDCKEKYLKEVLDRKEHLGYNVSNLEAPSRLESILLSRNIEVAFPKRAEVVKAAGQPFAVRNEKNLKTASLENKSTWVRIFDFFGSGAEAHAREK
jgi:hypothetical protein